MANGTAAPRLSERGAGGRDATVGGVTPGQTRDTAQSVAIRLFVTEGSVELPDGRQIYQRGFGTDADDPAGVLRAIEGDRVTVSVTNTLDEPHGFAIAEVVDSGPIAPGATATVRFDAPAAGTYMYADPLGAPLNRVLGLNGAMVVSPAGVADAPFAAGPGFARDFVWVFNCIDSTWSERARLRRPIDPAAAFVPDVFLLNGLPGGHCPEALPTTPHGPVGEPTLVRMINAGLTGRPVHFHGHRMQVLARNKAPRPIVMGQTVFVDRGEIVEVLLPFKAPSDPFPPARAGSFLTHEHQVPLRAARARDGLLF